MDRSFLSDFNPTTSIATCGCCVAALAFALGVLGGWAASNLFR